MNGNLKLIAWGELFEPVLGFMLSPSTKYKRPKIYLGIHVSIHTELVFRAYYYLRRH